MFILETVSKFNIEEDLWNEAIENHSVIADEFNGVGFYKIAKKLGKLNKGMIVAGREVVTDFPRIARILQLENGIKLAFHHSR